MAYNRANGQPTRNGQRKYYLPRIDLEKLLLFMEEIFMIIQLKVILKNTEY